MKRWLIIILLLASHLLPAAAQNEEKMDRIEICKANYRMLFGEEALTGNGSDPELMDILQKYVFGEVFTVGDLDLKTRELITCTTLAVMQTLPQLKSHAAAALRVGVTPIELREAIYQCAPFIGFPKTLNAAAAINEVFTQRGIALPLDPQANVGENDRFEKGRAIQQPLYGDEMREKLSDVPFGGEVARFLTEFGFGDLYARGGLHVQTRELLVFCQLATLGAEEPLRSHVKANLQLGNSGATLAAALVQCLPYIGFPPVLRAFGVLEEEL